MKKKLSKLADIQSSNDWFVGEIFSSL